MKCLLQAAAREPTMDSRELAVELFTSLPVLAYVVRRGKPVLCPSLHAQHNNL